MFVGVFVGVKVFVGVFVGVLVCVLVGVIVGVCVFVGVIVGVEVVLGVLVVVGVFDVVGVLVEVGVTDGEISIMSTLIGLTNVVPSSIIKTLELLLDGLNNSTDKFSILSLSKNPPGKGIPVKNIF